MIRISIVAPNRAPTTPRTLPIEARSSDSVSTCRTMRKRPAPSETRTAISCWRAAPRASSRLPMLAQASSSRPPTIVISSSSGPPNCCCSGVSSPVRAGVTSIAAWRHCGSPLASASMPDAIQHPHLGARLRRSTPRLQPRHERQPRPSIASRPASSRERHPDVRPRSRRRFPRTRAAATPTTVTCMGAGTRVSVMSRTEPRTRPSPLKSARPVPPAHDGHRGSAWPVVGDVQHAPQHRLHAERLEEITGDHLGGDRVVTGVRLRR